MKNYFLLQSPKDKNGNMTLMKVYNDGRIICDCLNNLWNIQRDYCSYCKHSALLRAKIIKGNIEEYTELVEIPIKGVIKNGKIKWNKVIHS